MHKFHLIKKLHKQNFPILLIHNIEILAQIPLKVKSFY